MIDAMAAVSGAFLVNIEEFEERFALEPVDAEWAEYQSVLIRTDFVNSYSLVDYELSQLTCKASLCRGEVTRLECRRRLF